MTGRDLFGALTRFVGLLVTTYGAYTFIYEVIGTVVPDLPQRVARPLGLVFGVVEIALGLILLLGAEPITSVAYRRKNPN